MLPKAIELGGIDLSDEDGKACVEPQSRIIRTKQSSTKQQDLGALRSFALQRSKTDDVLLSPSLLPLTSTPDKLGPRPLRILVAPSGFKESLGPEHVANAIEAGIRRVLNNKSAILHKLPLHDGGEGFARALVTVQDGSITELPVTGPVGAIVTSHFGQIGEDGKTAVLDMAAAAGLRLVPRNARDPTLTTTYGVGQLIAKALDAGCTRIIIGCGDSGTSDGGAGMLQALGVRFLDVEGEELPRADGGRSLLRLDRLCWRDVHPRLRENAGKCVWAQCIIRYLLTR